MSTVKELVNLGDYFELIVQEDYTDYKSSISLRKCVHLAQSLFHMADWAFSHERAALESLEGRRFESEKDIYPHLALGSSSFGLIRDIANASKHVNLSGKPSTNIKNVTDLKIETSAFGEGTFGTARYGGINPIAFDGDRVVYLDEHMHEVFQYWLDFTNTISTR
ncbi:hypothetical protein SAMN04488001_2801 [Litoreibacter albidus]|uniref:Uncharacterized protein n=2 Tax=Litoreibacter albidus TaxID=670155 RepID=A0A1H3ABK6_9RHOB|nr:hypothetical protein SAMN04488001_2801 [Litoreibacter albidus]